MHDIQIRSKLIDLRKKGKSIKSLSKEFGLSPSTVSYWCKDIVLSKSLINKIGKDGRKKALQASLLYSEILRKGRIKRVSEQKQKGIKMIGSLSRKETLMIGVGLYWGEGYKYHNAEFGFTNSNMPMIKFYLKWLGLFGVIKRDLILRLTINEAFLEEEKKIKKFWIENLKVTQDQFSATTVIKSKLKKAYTGKDNTYHGILRIKVRKGIALKNQILGAIEHVSLL